MPEGHTGPCPQCGSIYRTFRVEASDTLKIKVSCAAELRQEYYQKNLRAFVLGVGVTIALTAVGLYFTGLIGAVICAVVSIAGLWYFPSVKTKVIEKTRFHSD